jgi:hypothetical protein
MVMAVPAAPELWLRLVMLGGKTTVKSEPLLACAPTVTTTLPVVAPEGTTTVMLVTLQALAAAAAVPLKVTVLPPCVPPKSVPVMVIDTPTAPDVWLRVLMTGATVKGEPLLTVPNTVTTTLPVVAPLGTATVMLVALHALAAAAVVPLKATVLDPWVAPKLVPVMVMDVPTAPEFWLRLVILGGSITVKGEPLLACPLTVTTTFPVVAPAGTVTVMLVALQALAAAAAVPLKVTVLAPCVVPKLVPVIVIETPTAPDGWLRLVIAGATANADPLLAAPKTVTTTLPLVAAAGTVTVMLIELQTLATAEVPLNVTVLELWVAPKFVPVIVMDVPTGPEVWLRLVMLGGGITVKGDPLLACPPTVTTTFPVVAPAGTFATMLVALQVVTVVAAVPLKVTVLPPCVAPKLVPVIVMEAPIAPEVWLKLVIAGTTANAELLLVVPNTVTTTLPVVAAAGTVTVMLVALQTLATAAVPLNATVLDPCVAPNPVPVILMAVPIGAETWLKLVITGGGTTVKGDPLLACAPTVTSTLPVVAPTGTVTVMLVALQVVTVVAAVPLKVTVLPPCVAPKLVPVMMTETPTAPEAWLKLVIAGATENTDPLLATPDTVTTTLPVDAPAGTVTVMLVALQALAVAAVPLKVTVLLPWVAPKLLPVIVTDAATAPEVWLRLLIMAGTTKLLPLLAVPATVTTTLPVVVPAGTVAVMLVSLQLPIVVAVIPLKVTVLPPWVAPNFVPVIVMEVPTAPEVWLRLVIVGAVELLLLEPPPQPAKLQIAATETSKRTSALLTGLAFRPAFRDWVRMGTVLLGHPTSHRGAERFRAMAKAAGKWIVRGETYGVSMRTRARVLSRITGLATTSTSNFTSTGLIIRPVWARFNLGSRIGNGISFQTIRACFSHRRHDRIMNL